MRAMLAILLATVSLVAVSAQGAPAAPAKKLQVVSSNYEEPEAKGAMPVEEDTTSPRIVSAVGPEEAEGDDNAVEVPDYTSPAKPAAGAFDSHFDKLENRLDENQKNLADITKQVADSLHERKRLLLVGEEMHALMSLHKAAKMLNDNQKEVDAVEEEIKKLGEEAEELIRERAELKHQIEEELKEKDEQLEATRGKLAELDEQLSSLHAEHDHATRLVNAWQSRAKAIRAAREKHEEMDAMAHLVGAPGDAAAAAAGEGVAFPAGHSEPVEPVPEVTASDDDLAKLEKSITDFASRHVHTGKGEKAAEPAAPAAAPAKKPTAAPAPAEEAAAAPAEPKFMQSGSKLMTHNRA